MRTLYNGDYRGNRPVGPDGADFYGGVWRGLDSVLHNRCEAFEDRAGLPESQGGGHREGQGRPDQEARAKAGYLERLVNLPCRALVAGMASLKSHVEHVNDAWDVRLDRIERKIGDGE